MAKQDEADSTYTVVVNSHHVEGCGVPETATHVPVPPGPTWSCHPTWHSLVSHPCTAYLAATATSLTFVVVVILFQPSLFYSAPAGYSNSSSNNVCLTPECVQTAASLLGAMDASADPCHDFFQYACGQWNKKNVIPEDRSSISTFEVLADKLQIILRVLLEEGARPSDNNVTLMAKSLYRSCVNMTRIVEIGDAPLRRAIGSFGGWPVIDPGWSAPASLEAVIAGIRTRFNMGVLIEVWVGPDDRQENRLVGP